MTTANKVKEQIVNRLHKRAGICAHCGKRGCAHTSTNLPRSLKLEDVLWAINLDNYFEAESK